MLKKKMHNQSREPQPYDDCQAKSIQFLKTKVTAPVYQYISEHFMLPSADQLFKDADFIFQQDLAPAHTAKSTKSWLNDHGVGVTISLSIDIFFKDGVSKFLAQVHMRPKAHPVCLKVQRFVLILSEHK